MPRIELWTTVFAGLAGGLAGVLWHGTVTAAWLARLGGAQGDARVADTAARLFAAAAMRAVAGGLLGFLFWLGWGLIALVGQPWYAIGALYGVLCWAATVAPLLGSLLLRGHAPARVLAAYALEWLFACSAIGLLCASAWHRYAWAMRNVYVLAIAQALSAAGMMTVFLLGGILGSQFAPMPQLATLPVSLTVVGLAATAIPAALLMERIGRRNAFVASASLAALAALAVSWAVVRESFAMLCGATLVLGANLAFQQQHRFAAAESVSPGRVSTAVSIVMVGTLVAAAVGPQVALALKDLVPGHEYAGSFVGVAALLGAAAAVLTRCSTAPPHEHHGATGAARPLAEVVRQPAFLLAVGAAVVSYAVMSFIMTATPISMHVHDGHSDTDTAWVIQGHLLAMYGPSLFSGGLIGRIGARAGMAAGLALMLACVAIDSSGRGVMHYWWGLALLGVGWNLLFVAGTALLTTTYRSAERFRAQAVNEFSVFGTQALASLLAGPAIHAIGWRALNLATLVPLALFAAALLAWPGQRSRNSRV